MRLNYFGFGSFGAQERVTGVQKLFAMIESCSIGSRELFGKYTSSREQKFAEEILARRRGGVTGVSLNGGDPGFSKLRSFHSTRVGPTGSTIVALLESPDKESVV
jgi:hypothetical protein